MHIACEFSYVTRGSPLPSSPYRFALFVGNISSGRMSKIGLLKFQTIPIGLLLTRSILYVRTLALLIALEGTLQFLLDRA
jgi:hypothetical protein